MNKLSKTTAPDWFIEYDVRINKRLDSIELRLSNLEKDMIEVKEDIAEIKSLPTIQRELKQKLKTNLQSNLIVQI